LKILLARALNLIVLCLAIVGVSRADSGSRVAIPSDYWPVSSGSILEYHGQVKYGGVLVVQSVIVRSHLLGRAEFNGSIAEKSLEYVRVEQPDGEYVESELFEYVLVDSLQVRTVAFQPQGGEPQEWPSDNDFSLRAPLEEGRWWTSVAPGMIRLAGNYVDPEFRTIRTVEKLGVEVGVPAGTYVNCIEVAIVGTSSDPLLVRGLSGKKCDAYIEVSKRVWRAPGLGLVKQIVTTRAFPVGYPDSTFSWEEYELELVSQTTSK